MMYEYAVDPALFNLYDKVRYFQLLFGRDKGRLIAYYPDDGKDNIWKSLVNINDTEINKKRAEEIIANMLKNNTFIKYDRPLYDTNNYNWCENAYNHHCKHRKFKAIITNAKNTDDIFINGQDDLFSNKKINCIKKEEVVQRSAKKLAEVAKPLLCISKIVKFVDPYFNPTIEKWQNTLREFINIANNSAKDTIKYEYHLSYYQLKKNDNNFGSADKNSIKMCFENSLKNIIPKNTCIDFYLWEKLRDGQKLHARYILTDIAGISYEHGLDEGEHKETTDVKLVAEEIYNERWNQYDKDGNTFRCINSFELIF